jgi:hypothetical protein
MVEDAVESVSPHAPPPFPDAVAGDDDVDGGGGEGEMTAAAAALPPLPPPHLALLADRNNC